MNQLTKDSMLYFLGRAFSGLAGLFCVVVFIRILGAKNYGEYALIQTTILFVGNLAPYWLTQGIVRFYSKCTSVRMQQAFNQVVSWGLIITLIIFTPLLGLAFLFFSELQYFQILIAVLSMCLLIIYGIKVVGLQVRMGAQAVLKAECVRSLLNILVPLFLLFGLHMDGVTALLGGFAIATLSAILVARSDVQFVLIRKIKKVKKFRQIFISFGAPVFLWLALSSLLSISDRYIIKWYLGDAAVGTYVAIYDIIYNAFLFILAPILFAIHPYLMKLWNEGDRRASVSILKKALAFELVLGVLIIIFLSYNSNWLIELIIGHSDKSASTLLIPIALGAFFWQIAVLLQKTLEIQRHTKPMVVYVLIALIINIIGNITLIPHYGYVAAAYTTFLSSLVYMLLILTNFSLKQTFKYVS